MRGRPEVVNLEVTPEQRVLGAGLVIAAADILTLVHMSNQAKPRIAAGGIGRRQQLRQFKCRGVIQSRTDLVIGEQALYRSRERGEILWAAAPVACQHG